MIADYAPYKDGETAQMTRRLNDKSDEIESLEKEVLRLEDENKTLSDRVDNIGESSNKVVSESTQTEEVTNVYNMRASHYSAYCPTCGEWGGITTTGDDISSSIYVRGLRVVAVDPSIITLGSKVRVTGVGYDFEALALDTGGDIKGNRIDILVNSTEEAYSLGMKDVKVEVLE